MPTFATNHANGDEIFTVLSGAIKAFTVTKTDISVVGNGESEVLTVKYSGTIDNILRQVNENRCSATAQGAADILVDDYEEENP